MTTAGPSESRPTLISVGEHLRSGSRQSGSSTISILLSEKRGVFSRNNCGFFKRGRIIKVLEIPDPLTTILSSVTKLSSS